MLGELEIGASIPWVQSRFELLSWWEMQRFSAVRFFTIGSLLQRVRYLASKFDNEGLAFPKDTNARKWLDVIALDCKAIGLAVSVKCATSIADELGRGHLKMPDYAVHLQKLHDVIKWEIEDKLFMFIPSHRADYYDQPQLFGPEVAAKFPSTQFEIAEAGNCYATGRSTACVFHLMRVMEVGLKALAKALEIPYAPSWESYIKQINSKVADDHKNKDAAWKKDEPIFRDLAADLVSVKNAWRNPTMHIVNKYTEDEAENILRAVGSFMKKMAEKFSEVID